FPLHQHTKAMNEQRRMVPSNSSTVLELKRSKQAAARTVLLEKRNIRRNQSKLNQRRYRAEQKVHIETLENEVNDLQTYVSRLEGRLEYLRRAVSNLYAQEMTIVCQFFVLFAKGYHMDAAQQHDFLHNMIADNLIYMGQASRMKLIEQLEGYSRQFASFDMQCTLIEGLPHASSDKLLKAHAIMQLGITNDTIQTVFPHISSSLAQKMTGKSMRLSMMFVFCFDMDGIVYRLESTAEIVAALALLVSSVEEALLVLEGSLITAEGELLHRRATSLDKMRSRDMTKEEWKEWQRKRSQKNQQRYRVRKQRAMHLLEQHINVLNHSVFELDIKAKSLQTAGASGVAYEYFRIFENGLNTTCQQTYNLQCHYLHNAMSPTLCFMDEKVDGRAKLITQLNYYSTLFLSLHMTCRQFDVVLADCDEIVVRALAVLHLRMSRSSIEVIYPNLIGSSEHIVQRLIGCELEVPILCHFHIDKITYQVHTMTTEADIIAAASNLLGNLKDSSLALESSNLKANVSQKWIIKVVLYFVMFTQVRLNESENDEREARYRMRSQVNQRRYRQRKKEAQKQLEQEVVHLRQTNERLMENLRLVRTLDGSTQNARGIAKEYYRLFEHGLRQAAYDVQANFLRSTMSHRLKMMDYAEVDGPTKILEQLHLYTSLFDSHHLELDQLETILESENEVVVKVTAALALRLSRLSVATVFPNLIGKNEPLVQKLIGKTLTLRIVSHLHYGKETERIESIFIWTNITTAAVNLIGNLNDSLLALDKPAIKQNGELVVPQSWQ
ncbi:hypothetical protein THRCLA_01138, partial [Thraustotheca clavata]